ncbi:MAG: beta-hydroxyacyl-ACP dehydratase [Clostridia bacterium]|nr:3-hydroxyacyl-ACP dehydratase FabZ [Eubacteriales bacterium]MDD3866158.1 3-hydroxyacyl-ACP dehydratase FabZ [Eubacteriales bacterium]MDD4461316.1 3-hydroxyacyl-ACP dehydratase FabZ [Eubacteriales bacterium]NCC47959.1 beta-hydroxyacyl-ACP dehydratase [Clostridia bacterium]
MMNREAIQQIIPHRPPFLFLDEVHQLTESTITASWHLTGRESFFAGHFPGQPVLPGVLMVESLAQAGAVCILSLPEFKGRIAYFGGMRDVRFRQKVKPGDTLILQVEIIQLRGRIGFGKGRVLLGDKLAASATLTFAIGD